jgi:hypothetical protein
MLSRKSLIILLLTAVACSREIEIPDNKAGVVYIRPDEIADEVLKPGSHTIPFLSRVSLHDIRKQKIDFKFDILFKDASDADIEFSIVYSPVVDNLPRTCRMFQLRVDENSLAQAVETEIRSQVRELLMETDSATVDEAQIFSNIERYLKTQSTVAGLVHIRSFSRGKIMDRE